MCRCSNCASQVAIWLPRLFRPLALALGRFAPASFLCTVGFSHLATCPAGVAVQVALVKCLFCFKRYAIAPALALGGFAPSDVNNCINAFILINSANSDFSRKNLFCAFLEVFLFHVEQFNLIMKTSKQNAQTLTSINSAITLPAQSTKLLYLNDNKELIELFDKVNSVLNSNEPAILKWSIALLFSSGLRISELLRLSRASLVGYNKLFVVGSKGSSDRIIDIVFAQEFTNRVLSSGIPIGDIYSRYYFHRNFKRLGFSAKFGSNENNSVTHFFRHMYALQLINNNVNRQLVSKEIGHLNSKSINYYDKQKKG